MSGAAETGGVDTGARERLAPGSHDDVVEAVRWAAANTTPLEVVGGGTKRGWGRPAAANYVLDLSALSGVTLYEPEELVLSAGAATPLAEIEALLAEREQQLAFEPPDFGPLFGQPAGRQTLGGVIATNLSGARRVKAGAARDHLLGFTAVSGRGEAFKSGGRVVKNVTGYDLSKLMAGSFGTLGVMTEITVKALPRGEKTRTVLLYGLDDAAGVAALPQALNSPHEVSGAAHLPAAVAGRSGVSYVGGQDRSVSAIRIEGPGPSVEHRCAAIRSLWAGRGDTEELHGRNSALFWNEINSVHALLGSDDGALWRLSLPPAAAVAAVARLRAETRAEAFYNWGGGQVWLTTETAESVAGMVRSACCMHEDNSTPAGHAMLVRGPVEFQKLVPVFPPQDSAVAALSERLRGQFDPNNILNPSRMG